jgi:hypothetical protein
MAYTINQLAKLSGVSTRTLRFYDEIGLLAPAFYGENQYRFATRDIFKEDSEIFTGAPVISNSSSDEAVEQSAGVSAGWGCCEQPVFASEREGSNLIISRVIVDFKAAVQKVVIKFLPAVYPHVAGGGVFAAGFIHNLKRCLVSLQVV